MIKILKYGEVATADIVAPNVPTVNVTDTVAEILSTVRREGDAALFRYTAQFDKAELISLAVTAEEIEEAVIIKETES